MEALIDLLAAVDWLEFAGFASGLLCVWLLIRQDVRTWPLGIVYAVISIPVFLSRDLPAQALLHGVFLVFNGYGWWYWARGGREGEAILPVTRTAPPVLAGLLVAALLAALPLGLRGSGEVPAAVAFVDAAILTLTLAAMWLSTRKKIENWVLWFVVDVLASGLFLHQGLFFYAALYLVYLLMAVLGWRAWRVALAEPAPA